MRPCTHSGGVRIHRIGVALVSVAMLCATARAADRLPPDPVEELKAALKSSADAAQLETRISALRSVGDLRRALALEWIGDTSKQRDQVIERLTKALHATLRDGDMTSRLAALTMIGELGVVVSGADATKADAPKALSQVFTNDLAEIVKRGEPRVSEAAARALGKIAPQDKTTIDALGQLLTAPIASQRLAAADALNETLQLLIEVAFAGSKSALRVEPATLARVASLIVPAAAKGLSDRDVHVRRRSLETILSASTVLTRFTPRVDAERRSAALLIQALVDIVGALARGLRDSDPEVRRLAGRTLENMGTAREMLRHPLTPAPSPVKEGRFGGEPDGPNLSALAVAEIQLAAERRTAAQAVGEDTLLPGLRTALPTLIEALRDPDERVRLSVVDVLETMGSEAASAVPAINKALGDPNRFVRWSAARALGKIGPVADSAASVSGLAKLLDDTDLDVRLATCLALERLGPNATGAIPALTQSVKGPDATLRTAAIRALVGIGRESASALPTIAGALSDADARVRRTAAEALGRFGPTARESVAALTAALNDSDADVRKAASDALLSVQMGVGK